MAPTAAFLVLLALMSNPFCFHQNGIIWAPNAPLLTLRRPILVIAACSHISYAGNTHNNHKIAPLRQTSHNHVHFKLHPKTTAPCWSGGATGYDDGNDGDGRRWRDDDDKGNDNGATTTMMTTMAMARRATGYDDDDKDDGDKEGSGGATKNLELAAARGGRRSKNRAAARR